jgi:argininosuccinate lyase
LISTTRNQKSPINQYKVIITAATAECLWNATKETGFKTCHFIIASQTTEEIKKSTNIKLESVEKMLKKWDVEVFEQIQPAQ